MEGTKPDSVTKPEEASDVKACLRSVLSDIKKAEEARGGEKKVQLVAVSKKKANNFILEAYDEGQRVFGENYVKELVTKSTELPEDIQWHMIGHLQSNKAKQVANIKNITVESVDTVTLAEKLDAAREKTGFAPIPVYVQVNTGDYPTKSGISGAAIDGIKEIVETVRRSKHLEMVGLMTIGRIGGGSEDFEMLRHIRDTIDPVLKLSMGMSEDFELAIKEGADIVRVGSRIFGARL